MKDMSTLVTARQKLESQQQENKGVQKVTWTKYHRETHTLSFN